MRRAVLPILAAMAAACTASGAEAQSDLSGRWSQSSSGKELVLAPRIKLQPNYGYTAGTSLGGSVGMGSMTRTTIVTEPVMMDVAREMSLTIAADRRFSWTIVKRHAEGKCVKTTTQVKEGRVESGSGRMVFAISGGTEKWQSSCGESGTGTVAPGREAYEAALQGGTLRLVSGPSRWVFQRG